MMANTEGPPSGTDGGSFFSSARARAASASLVFDAPDIDAGFADGARGLGFRLFYPLLKRVTPLCHFGVGTALALSPLGGIKHDLIGWQNRPTYQQVVSFPAGRGQDISNLAAGRTSTASSVESPYAATRAVDGDPASRWASSACERMLVASLSMAPVISRLRFRFVMICFTPRSMDCAVPTILVALPLMLLAVPSTVEAVPLIDLARPSTELARRTISASLPWRGSAVARIAGDESSSESE